jgi:tetratricopeptide (TPR) repeat protein
MQLCGCGSGLRWQRCCGFDPHSWGPFVGAGPLEPLIRQAVEAAGHADREAAIRSCLDVLELLPWHEGCLALLARLHLSADNRPAAEALLRRAVKINPNDLLVTQNLCMLLFNNGALDEAEIHARNAVRIAPDNPQSHNMMGMVLTEANRPQIGEYHYRKVLELIDRPDAIVLANLAWNLKQQGRMEEARVLYRQSVASRPSELKTLLGWARLEEADRQFAAAERLLEQAERVAPGDPGVRLTRAAVAARQGRTDAALMELDELERANGAGLGPMELSEKGRLLDRMGRYAEAFAAFAQAKKRALDLGTPRYMAEAAEDLTQRLRHFFIAGRLAMLPRAEVREDTAQPIFILGFPRSGTTLAEQMLSAHPRIAAGDELPFIGDVAQAMSRILASPLNYPEALCELWMGDQREGLDVLRDYYLQRVRQTGAMQPGAEWFTDKMPLNEMHLGLIALLFPVAPLIHMVRHPLDVVLSVFSNHLTHGYYCAAELESAARHYVLIAELVEAYRTEMELRYLQVRYEDLVMAQETTVRGILDFIRAEFDPACLAFHENRRYARTASYAQVTEQLYERSCYRYKNYRRELQVVVPILAPTMAKLGYEY